MNFILCDDDMFAHAINRHLSNFAHVINGLSMRLTACQSDRQAPTCKYPEMKDLMIIHSQEIVFLV